MGSNEATMKSTMQATNENTVVATAETKLEAISWTWNPKWQVESGVTGPRNNLSLPCALAK